MLWIIMLTLYTALINGQNTLDIFSRNSFIFFFIVLFDRLWFICYWFDVMKFKNALIRFNVFCSVCMYFNILSWPISTVCENQVYHFLLSEKVKVVFCLCLLFLSSFKWDSKNQISLNFLCDGTKTLVSKWFWV